MQHYLALNHSQTTTTLSVPMKKIAKLSNSFSTILRRRIKEIEAQITSEQDWDDIQKIFIISTGRTGTQFLARLFNSSPDISAHHEPIPDFLKLGTSFARGELDEAKVGSTVRRGRRAIARKLRHKNIVTYVESNNRLFSLIPILRREFINYKIVHVVRDGRDYVRSGMSRPWYSNDDFYLPNRWFTHMLSPRRLRACDFPEDPYASKWHKMSIFEKICWRWQKKDGFIYEATNGYNDAITVTFKKLFKTEDYRGLKRICDFTKLPYELHRTIFDRMKSNRINSTTTYALPKWTNWTKKQKTTFDHIAGAHMRNYFDYSWRR